MAGRFCGPGKPFEGFVQIGKNGQPGPHWTGKVELVENHLEDPLHWRKPQRVFVNSMSDLFHEALPDEAIDRIFAVMALCPQHTFQVLTKRRMQEVWSRCGPLPNVWLGVSVEDQATADERIPLLLQTPAPVRFVSYEPALGPVDFTHLPFKPGAARTLDALRCPSRVSWIIVGGESGPGARRFDLEWMRSVVSQCKAAGVSVFCKQIGSNPYWAGYEMGRAKKQDRKGGDWSQWPSDLRVRQFPACQATAP
jgi:protein gp37